MLMTMTTDPTDDEGHEAIRLRAYMIWLAEGQPDGRADDHWLQAVAVIEQETEQMVSSAASGGPPASNPRPKRK